MRMPIIARSRRPTTCPRSIEARSVLAWSSDLRRLTFNHLIPVGSDGGRRVENDDVPEHKPIKELANRCQVLLLCWDASLMLGQVLADKARRNPLKIDASALAPGKEPADRPTVSGPRMPVWKLSFEEFVPGETSCVAGLPDDCWEFFPIR